MEYGQSRWYCFGTECHFEMCRYTLHRKRTENSRKKALIHTMDHSSAESHFSADDKVTNRFRINDHPFIIPFSNMYMCECIILYSVHISYKNMLGTYLAFFSLSFGMRQSASRPTDLLVSTRGPFIRILLFAWHQLNHRSECKVLMKRWRLKRNGELNQKFHRIQLNCSIKFARYWIRDNE